jgi:hypothetical protein
MESKTQMKIEIFTEHDSSYCETCGSNYDEGGYVLIDGVEIFRYIPLAACWGNANYDESDLLFKALEVLGHTITVDGEMPHALYKYNDGDK